jgi:hypothetical protein
LILSFSLLLDDKVALAFDRPLRRLAVDKSGETLDLESRGEVGSEVRVLQWAKHCGSVGFIWSEEVLVKVVGTDVLETPVRMSSWRVDVRSRLIRTFIGRGRELGEVGREMSLRCRLEEVFESTLEERVDAREASDLELALLELSLLACTSERDWS